MLTPAKIGLGVVAAAIAFAGGIVPAYAAGAADIPLSWPWALPFAGGLLVAIPFCVMTSSPRLSARLRRRGIAAVPEEIPLSAGGAERAEVRW